MSAMLQGRTKSAGVEVGFVSDSNESCDEGELEEAVASSGALVGENVLDSPNPRRFRVTSATSAATNGPFPMPPLSQNNTNIVDSSTEISVGIMAQGLAWVQRQRQRRRRLYLQNQAEQQLQKIRQAAQEELEGDSTTAMPTTSGLLDNPTFQSLKALTKATELQPSRSADSNRSSNNSCGESSAMVSASGDGYSVQLPESATKREEDASWIPPVRVETEPNLEVHPYILTANEMQQVARRVLPQGIAYCRWIRLYSLARDGDSFDACLRLVSGHSRTLLVVRTSKNHVLGGFADEPWQCTQGFSYYGGSEACLFQVVEGKVKYYKWTGANRYIQLCDASHKMIAFGGGGDDGAFGLSVEQDFQVGSTGPCATFENDPLCDQETFSIVDLEIYGFLIGQF